MHTSAQAVLWELWRTSRLELLLRIGLLTVLVPLISIVAVARQFGEPEMRVISGIIVLLISAISVSTSGWWFQLDRPNLGFCFRLGFTRPISTLQLVGLPMLFTALASSGCYVIPALIANLFLPATLPLMGPIFIITFLVLCTMAAAWSPPTILGKLASLAVLAVCIYVSVALLHSWHSHAEPLLMAMGRPEYFYFGWAFYVSLLILSALAVMVTVYSVDRQRHGGSSVSVARGRSVKQTRARAIVTLPAFRNRFTAQCSYEFRRFGRAVLILAALLAMAALTLVCIVPIVDAGWIGGPFVWLVVLVLSPPAFQLVGSDGALGIRRKQGVVQYPTFDATRTLTNDQLITIKLLMIAVCSLAGWLLIALTAASHAVVAGELDNWSRILGWFQNSVGDVSTFWWLVGGLCAALLYVSSCSMILAFGLWLPLHGRLLLSLTVFLYANGVLAVLDVQNDWSLRLLWNGYGYLGTFIVLALCGSVFRRAYLAGSLSQPLFVFAFCLWLVYVPTMLAVSVKLLPESMPVAAIMLGVSLLLVPIAATASAPLALAAHRHA